MKHNSNCLHVVIVNILLFWCILCRYPIELLQYVWATNDIRTTTTFITHSSSTFDIIWTGDNHPCKTSHYIHIHFCKERKIGNPLHWKFHANFVNMILCQITCGQYKPALFSRTDLSIDAATVSKRVIYLYAIFLYSYAPFDIPGTRKAFIQVWYQGSSNAKQIAWRRMALLTTIS